MNERKAYKRMGYEIVEEDGKKTLIVKGPIAFWYRQNGADASLLQDIGDKDIKKVIDAWIASASVPEMEDG